MMTDNKMAAGSIHKLYLDILRIIGTFLVLFNHTPGYHLYKKPHQPVLTWFYMIISMFTRVNWPVFFLISGALLLPNNKNESLQQTYRKRVSRFAVVLFVFQLFVFYFHHKEFTLQSIPLFLQALLSGKFKGAYASTWYLYAYLGFLVMLPYLRKIAKGFSKTDFRVLIGFFFLIKTLFPIYRAVWTWTGHEKFALSSDFDIPIMTCRAIFLPLIGYYLDSVLDIKTITRRNYLLLSAVTITGMLISCAFCYYQGTRTEEGFTTDYHSLFYYMTTIWLFITVKRICVSRRFFDNTETARDRATEKRRNSTVLRQSRGAKAICFCSSLTFGIYLFDPILKDITGIDQIIYRMLNPLMPSLASAIIYCILSFVFCGFLTAILKYIPGIRKLL